MQRAYKRPWFTVNNKYGIFYTQMHLIGDRSDSQNMVLRPTISSSARNSKTQALGPDPRPTESKKKGAAISV